MKYAHALLLFLVAGMFIVIPGCKKATTEPEDTAVPNDIFPLITSRFIEYNGYLTQNDTETKIGASESGYYTKWNISGTVPVNAIFPNPPFTNLSGNAVLVRDTTKIPGVGVASKFTPVMIRYDSTTTEYSFLTNLGYFYRAFQIKAVGDTTIRSDSLRWIILAKPSAGIGGTWASFGPENFSGTVGPNPVTVTLKIDGRWDREDVVIGTTTYQTYKITISRLVTSGSTTLSGGTTARVWAVQGLGPVQMHLFGDAESHGNFRKMTGKNF